MGKIADMVRATKRSRSPLQQELDGMTKVFGLIAWLAVAVIAIFGIARGQELSTLVLLCISTAIASIPTGLPTFVQAMLSSGARRLAESKAVVKSLTDVETLGGTTVINSDKTGTLTMNAMTATTMLAGGEWFRIEGPGYQKTGAILGVAGGEAPDFRRLAMGLIMCTLGQRRAVQLPRRAAGRDLGLSRSVSNLGSSLGTAIAGTTATPERSYGLAMIVLAAVGLLGLAASALLPRTPAPADTPAPRAMTPEALGTS
jgi:magnesium-transporting ATPase (P-type)